MEAASDRKLPGVVITPTEWRHIGSGLSLLSIAALTAVVLGELDRLIASVPAGDGRSHPLNMVLSPAAAWRTESWTAWAGAERHEQLGKWIGTSALLDLVLVLALTLLFARLIALAPAETDRRVPTAAVVAYVVSEGFECLLQLRQAIAVSLGSSDAVAAVDRFMAAATIGKWVALTVFWVAVFRIPAYRREMAPRASRIAKGVWVHRLATLAILVLVVLSCIPAADLLDQLPDIQRQWADDDGWTHLAWAVVALLFTAALTFALGRRRTRLLVESRVRGWCKRIARNRWDAAGPWAIAPAALLLLGVMAVTFGGDIGTDFHWWSFLAMFGVSILVPILAVLTFRPDAPRQPRLGPDRERARAAWIVGDALAVLVLVAGSIGVVRSYVVPFTLGLDVGSDQAMWFSWVLIPVGAIVAMAAPALLLPRLNPTGDHGRSRISSRLDPNAPKPPKPVKPGDPRGRPSEPDDRELWDDDCTRNVSQAGPVEWISLVAAGAVLTVSMLWPIQIASALGGVAVALFAISAWVALLGAFTLLVQARELITPFRWMKLRAPPVLVLAIVLPATLNLIVSAISPDKTLHAVQVSNPHPVVTGGGERTLADRLTALRHSTTTHSGDDCLIEVGNSDGSVSRARPVFLIAAEGGGIRAAYWTASVLAAFNGCAAESGWIATGISGGSVGLAVASTVNNGFSADPASPDSEPVQRAKAIVESARGTAGPDVVSSVILGLAVGDLIAATTGVHVPSYLGGDADDTGWRWRDRAALAEWIWERDAPELGQGFSNRIDPLTGMIAMTSTDVVTKCRLLVDQAPIAGESPPSTPPSSPPGSPAPELEGATCDAAGGLPSTLGFRELSASGGTAWTTKCLASLDWSTAAMLSARFAIVTPTGGLPAVEPCDPADGAQFVDGGYVEPTSLATFADAAPGLMSLIAEKNALRRSDQPWLVPVLIYLRNTQGYDLADDAARAEAEPLVPITGTAARTNLTAENAWIQRITQALPAACPDSEPDCTAVFDYLVGSAGKLPGGAVVIAPGSTPAVVPPLGWALSETSQARFTSAILDELACGTKDVDIPPPDNGGYAGLAWFAEVMDFNPCARVGGQVEARTAPATAE